MTEYDLGKVVGEDGQQGEDGVGIASISKTGSSGLVDTYTITYTDGDTDTFTVTNGSDATVTIVSSWSATTSDSKVASEKLTKDSLDDKVSKSSTVGLLKNDGTVDTTSYSTFDGNYNNLSNKPTIPSASSTVPSADTTSGSYGSGTSYARSNHTHPKSSLYAESSHTHTKSQITDFPSLSTVATSGSYSDLSNKPSIPSASSDLSDGSDLVKKSSTSGLLKNDGSVMTGGTGSSNWAIGNHTHSAYVNPTKVTSWSATPSDSNVASEKLIKDSLDDKVSKSSTSGLLKNDGSVDTNTYLTSSAISGMLTSSDIADNLTTNDSTKVLSAKQGYQLNQLIGQAIAYINQ